MLGSRMAGVLSDANGLIIPKGGIELPFGTGITDLSTGTGPGGPYSDIANAYDGNKNTSAFHQVGSVTAVTDMTVTGGVAKPAGITWEPSFIQIMVKGSWGLHGLSGPNATAGGVMLGGTFKKSGGTPIWAFANAASGTDGWATLWDGLDTPVLWADLATATLSLAGSNGNWTWTAGGEAPAAPQYLHVFYGAWLRVYQ